MVCCRRENIESARTPKRLKTAEEWREHQADYFAAAITMPNATFKRFVNNLLRECGYYKGAIRLGLNDDHDILANDIVPDAISETYGVSKRAACIKLRKTGFVLNAP
jgi:Zn-dependent peptidase ImmA (M78 family)